MNIEYKSTPLVTKDIDEAKGIYTGYFASFNTKDSGGDTIFPGAFQKTFQEWGPEGKDRIRNLYSHSFFHPIGKPLVLKEDHLGAYHETQVSNTTLGKDTLLLIRDGVIKEHSFGYGTIKKEADPKGGRYLKEIKCYEYSVLVLGMNENTPVLDVKSDMDTSQLMERMQLVDKILKKGELQTEELLIALEYELKSWQEAIKNMKQPEPEREVIIVPEINTKAFTERLQQESVYTLFWLYNDVLRWEIFKTLRDAVIVDKSTAISNDIEAYKTVILQWVQQAVASGVFSENGLKQLELAKEEFEKKQLEKEKTKIDPSVPAPSHKDEAVSAIKALFADLKPGNHSKSEEAAKNHADPDIVQSVLDVFKELKKQGVN